MFAAAAGSGCSSFLDSSAEAATGSTFLAALFVDLAVGLDSVFSEATSAETSTDASATATSTAGLVATSLSTDCDSSAEPTTTTSTGTGADADSAGASLDACASIWTSTSGKSEATDRSVAETSFDI